MILRVVSSCVLRWRGRDVQEAVETVWRCSDNMNRRDRNAHGLMSLR